VSLSLREYKGKASFAGYFELKTPKLLLIEAEVIKDVLVKKFSSFHDNSFHSAVRRFCKT